MNKTVKGALAAAAAVALLTGGAGTLASWNDSTVLDTSGVTAGSLKLTNSTCDANWKYAPGKANANTTIGAIVPGDVITTTCRFTVVATGTNLEATLTTPAVSYPAAPNAPALTLTPTAVYKLDGTTLSGASSEITSAANGKVVTADITVDVPFGDTTVNGNATQLTTADLNDVTVALTQVNPN